MLGINILTVVLAFSCTFSIVNARWVPRMIKATAKNDFELMPNEEKNSIDQIDPSTDQEKSINQKAFSDVISSSRKKRSHRLRHHRKHTPETDEALNYLRKYGYLKDDGNLSRKRFRDSLKSFQQMVGLQENGKLTREIIEKMHMPRCGNEDGLVANSEIPKFPVRRLRKRFVQVSRWEEKLDKDDSLHLKWFVSKYTADLEENQIRDVIQKAFNLWSSQIGIPSLRVLNLTFSKAASISDSDINILWAEGPHDDPYPFDGAGNNSNILAHTFYPGYKQGDPLNGDMHFDDFERWTLELPNVTGDGEGAGDKGVYLPSVLVHEIGHALGLGHSMRQEAIMNPIYRETPLDRLKLDIDDQCAVNWNYVGKSNHCMFVWLWVEYSPLINATNVGMSTAPADFKIGTASEGAIGELALESHVTATLDGLQASKIPRCHHHNNHKSHFINALVKKLSFPRETAEKYVPVVCKYMQGLYDVVKRRQLEGSNSDGDTDAIFGGEFPNISQLDSQPHPTDVEQMRVHNYVARPRTYSPTDFERRLNVESESPHLRPHSDSTANMEEAENGADSRFSGTLLAASEKRFDEAFFRDVIKLFFLKN